MNKKWIVALACIVLFSPPSAWSHSDEFFDGRPSPHGGQTRMTGPYHLELVLDKNDVTVYVTDHIERDIATAGGEGKAVVKSKHGDVTIMLTPAGGNILKGKGVFMLNEDTVVVVVVKLPEYEAQTARFTPLKPKANGSAHGMDHGDMDHDKMGYGDMSSGKMEHGSDHHQGH